MSVRLSSPSAGSNGIAANPVTNRFYVANFGNGGPGITVFDATNNTKITTIDPAQAFYISVDVNTIGTASSPAIKA